MNTWEVAMTRRGQWARGNPIVHAVHVSLPRHSRTGKTYRAACGTQVRILTGEPFNPKATNLRSCPDCVTKVAQ